MKVAAIQLAPRLGDVAANLDACWRLGDAAGMAGARWIVLPEFFTTGMGFVPALADAALPPDGAVTDLLLALARRHGAIVGGSFLCRDADGHARNAFANSCLPGHMPRRRDQATSDVECGALCQMTDVHMGLNEASEGGVAPYTCVSAGADRKTGSDGWRPVSAHGRRRGRTASTGTCTAGMATGATVSPRRATVTLA